MGPKGSGYGLWLAGRPLSCTSLCLFFFIFLVRLLAYWVLRMGQTVYIAKYYSFRLNGYVNGINLGMYILTSLRYF